MRNDQLGLIHDGRRARAWAGVVVATAAATPVVVGSSSAFHDALAPRSASIAAAAFIPATAGIVSATVVSGGVALSWASSTVGGAPVAYRVVRTDDLGATSAVCTGSSVPVSESGTSRCIDGAVQPGRTYRYVQQPIVVKGGTETWTIAPSAPSQPVVIPTVPTAPRFAFAAVSTAVTSTKSGPVTLAYPAGTAVDDLLVLVSFGGRSTLPAAPSGWSELASTSLKGADSSHLWVAWRAADSSGSVTFDAQSNSAGTVTRLLRYARAAGVTDPPVLAGAVTSGTSVAGAAASSVGATTSAPAATVVEFAALREPSSIRLSSNGVTVRIAETTNPGKVSLAVGVGDSFVPIPGPTSGATWQQDGSTAEWLWASAAFR